MPSDLSSTMQLEWIPCRDRGAFKGGPKFSEQFLMPPCGTHPDENGVVRAYSGSCYPTPVEGRLRLVLRARRAIWPGHRHEPLIVAPLLGEHAWQVVASV